MRCKRDWCSVFKYINKSCIFLRRPVIPRNMDARRSKKLNPLTELPMSSLGNRNLLAQIFDGKSPGIVLNMMLEVVPDLDEYARRKTLGRGRDNSAVRQAFVDRQDR